MRSIGTLPDEQQAKRFADYLFYKGIENQVERDGSSWLIWVADDGQMDAAAQLLEKFLNEPDAADIKKSAGSTEQHQAAEEKADQQWRKRYRDRKQVFPNTSGYRTRPLTLTLIAMSVIVTLLSGFGDNVPFLKPFFISYFADPSQAFLVEVRHGQIWRLFTPVLIHGDTLHLLFNMLWLFQLGGQIEARNGMFRFAVLVVVIGVISNLGQYIWNGSDFGGMSGVVYGLFGYIWIRSRMDPASGFFIDPTSVMLMSIWFIVCFTGLVGPIANVAHAGGLIVGTLWGWLATVKANR